MPECVHEVEQNFLLILGVTKGWLGRFACWWREQSKQQQRQEQKADPQHPQLFRDKTPESVTSRSYRGLAEHAATNTPHTQTK